jgi:hypothetical protein
VKTAHSHVLYTILALSAVARLDAQGVTGCADTKFPPELPAPSAFVDSVHAMNDLAAFAAPSQPMVFSVVFNEGDSVAHVRALDQRDAAAAVSLANYVRREAPGELWAFRIRIAGGDTPALTLERSKYCPPVSRSGDMPYAAARSATITGSVAVEGNPPPLPQSGPSTTVMQGSMIPVEAIIAVDGRVIVARVTRPSGDPETEARIVRDMMRRKFGPAKLDGQPIQAVYRSGGESPRP